MRAIRKSSGVVGAVLALGLLVGGALSQPIDQARADDKVGEPIVIGFNAPLSGPVAGWGLPGLTGLKIWADWTNKDGGLLVGDTRHPIEIHQFDNEFVPSKALQGAKQLVLEEKAKFILDVGGATADAQVPFLMENGVFYAGLTTTDINPNRKYLIAGEDAFPRGEMMRQLYVKTVYPKAKTSAVISQEDAASFT